MKTLEELEAQNGIFSVDDVRVMFNNYKLTWNRNDGVVLLSFTVATECLGLDVAGSEADGIYSGHEFTSEDGKVSAITQDGIRGMTKATILACTDGYVIFY